jgi:hypothetical protein
MKRYASSRELDQVFEIEPIWYRTTVPRAAMDAMSETSIGSLSVKDGVAEFRFAGTKFTWNDPLELSH